MRPITICLIALASAFLFSASSCDWEGDEDPLPSASGTIVDQTPSSASSFFSELDIGGKYDGNLPNVNGGPNPIYLTELDFGVPKESLVIGVDGNLVTASDDQGNGYAGDVGLFMSEVNGDIDPFKQGTLLASRQISFSGFDETAGRNIEVTGTIKLISDGINGVADGGTIDTILKLEGTWVQIGGSSSDVDADQIGPVLDLSDFLPAD